MQDMELQYILYNCNGIDYSQSSHIDLNYKLVSAIILYHLYLIIFHINYNHTHTILNINYI